MQLSKAQFVPWGHLISLKSPHELNMIASRPTNPGYRCRRSFDSFETFLCNSRVKKTVVRELCCAIFSCVTAISDEKLVARCKFSNRRRYVAVVFVTGV